MSGGSRPAAPPASDCRPAPAPRRRRRARDADPQKRVPAAARAGRSPRSAAAASARTAPAARCRKGGDPSSWFVCVHRRGGPEYTCPFAFAVWALSSAGGVAFERWRRWSSASRWRRLCCAAACGRPAGAQASDPELRPTRGPYITDGARAGDADATAVQLNPGALAFLPAAGLELVGAYASDPAVVPRRGPGRLPGAADLLAQLPGLGLSRVAGASAAGIDAHTTLQLAYALRFLRNASLGVSWAHIWDGSFAGADTFDFGFSARVGRYVALGATVEDVGAAAPERLRRDRCRGSGRRSWLLRPLGTSRLEVALGAAHARRRRLGSAGAARAGLRHAGRRPASLRRGGERPARDRRDLRRRQRHAPGVRAGARLRSSGRGRRRPTSTSPAAARRRPRAGAAGRPSHPSASRAREHGAQRRPRGAGLRRPRAPRGDRRRPPLLRAGPPAARAGGRSGRRWACCSRSRGSTSATPASRSCASWSRLLRAHGKRTFGYLTFPSTREYYLAAACDVVLIHPAGELSVTGVAHERHVLQGRPWTASASTWTWCASARSRARWSRS